MSQAVWEMSGTPRCCLLALLCLGLRVQAATPAVSLLQVDPRRSTIEVLIHGTSGSFTGQVEQFSSRIEFDPELHQIVHTSVSFRFPDLKTGQAKRDVHMLEWLESSRYPEVWFRLESLEKGVSGGDMARGRLTIHGVERTVSFPVNLLLEDVKFSIDGEIQLDYRDFGLPKLRKYWIFSVDPQLRVRFHLQGRSESDPTIRPGLPADRN